MLLVQLTIYVLAALVSLLCVTVGVWVTLYRNTPIVESAQPLFLYLTLLGALITSLTPILLGFEPKYDSETGHVLDTKPATHACLGISWLYTLGFTLTFAPLFAKMWRIRRIFASRCNLTRIRITGSDVFPIVLGCLVIQASVLALWQIYDPLVFVVDILKEDEYGRVVESIGVCRNAHINVFHFSLMTLDVFALLAGNYLCYICRDIPTQFAEGKWISFSMFSWLQALLVSAPILILLSVDTDGRFAMQSLVVLVQAIVIISLIFGPKIALFYSNAINPRISRPSISRSIDSRIHLDDMYVFAPSPRESETSHN